MVGHLSTVDLESVIAVEAAFLRASKRNAHDSGRSDGLHNLLTL